VGSRVVKSKRLAKRRVVPHLNASTVSLSIEGRYRGIARAEIVRRVYAMIDALQLQQVEVSIVLTNDKSIHELNKLYRDKDRPTDVLAFAMREGELGHLAGGVLGDVIVSVETAKKQAHERGVSLLDEVTMLTAHGLLHLLGWDHDTKAKDRRMRAETDRLQAAARRVSRVPQSASKRRSKAGAGSLLSRNLPAKKEEGCLKSRKKQPK
jgi:probable rRNA maturation factor